MGRLTPWPCATRFRAKFPAGSPVDDLSARPYGPPEFVPGTYPDAAALLGRAGLRDPAALRHADGRRYVPHREEAGRAWPQALEGRLCAALAPAQGRPLRREPQPAAALLPVPGDPEAVARQHPGTLPGIAQADRPRFRPARHPLRRGRLGEPDAGCLGAGLGMLVR